MIELPASRDSGEKKQDETSAFSALFEKHHAACVLVYLLILEVLAFASVVAKVGFYLDDWSMISELHFAPAPLLTKIFHYLINDPKIIIRPVEALHFGVLYGIFGAKPLFWHIFNGALEVFAAWLVYLCANKLTQHRLLSFVAAAVFLLYPNHDSTHYWVLASSATLSIVAYLASLWFSMRAAESGRLEFEAAAVTCFAISIFNYECFLPLVALNVCASYWYAPTAQSWRMRKALIWRCLRAGLPMMASVLAYCLWSRVIVPKIATGWVHQVDLNQTSFLTTFERGLSVSVAPELPLFCAKFLRENATFAEAQAIPVAIGILALTAFMCWGLRGRQLSWSYAGQLLLLGLGIVLLSFTIFGLNPEYEPTLYTFVNRINYGASIGASLMVAALLCVICQHLPGRQGAHRLAIGLVTTSVLCFAVLTNWALAKPWILSWTMQRHVIATVKAHRAEILQADALMLANCPRYLRWAPLYDGVWDFAAMTRVMTESPVLPANVISERLAINAAGDAVVDTSHAFVCGTYSLKNMLVLDAPHSLLVPVHNAGDFIDVVKGHGMAFDLDRSLPAKWEKQRLAAAAGQL